MSQENSIKEKEYSDLRDEIKQKIELHNSLITFMITSVIAVLAFAVESDKTLLYLLPFGIIIPISMRIAYYRSAMVKLSAYLIVYIESSIKYLKWETRNIKFINKNENGLYDIITISHYYEGMILSVICYFMYLWDYYKDKDVNQETVIFSVLPLFLVLWEAIITKRISGFNAEKNKWVNKWKDFKMDNG